MWSRVVAVGSFITSDFAIVYYCTRPSCELKGQFGNTPQYEASAHTWTLRDCLICVTRILAVTGPTVNLCYNGPTSKNKLILLIDPIIFFSDYEDIGPIAFHEASDASTG